MTLKDNSKFEHLNAVSINVYGIENGQILPLRLTDDKKEKHVNMLHVQDPRNDGVSHFAWIKNLSRLVSAQISGKKNKKYFCDRCLHYFSSCEKLQSHAVNRQKINDCAEAFSIGYYVRCAYDILLSYHFRRDEDCIVWFARQFNDLPHRVKNILSANLLMEALFKKQWEAYRSATRCHICKKPFAPDDTRVRDHCHLTGKYHCPAHSNCNLNYKNLHTLNFDGSKTLRTLSAIAPDLPTGYILEVDLEIRSICTRYVIYYRNLQQWIRHSLRVTKIHRMLQFALFPWLCDYIELNAQFRTRAKNDFEKNLYKLMNNAVFGRTIQRGGNDRETENFHSRSIIAENLIAVEMRKLEVKFNKLIYVGMCVLDISKVCLYKFHEYMSPMYHDKCKIMYTDTDSLIYYIECDDAYETMKRDIARDLMMNENNGALMIGFIGFRAKMYAVTMNSKKDTKKVKSVKTITFDDYTRCLNAEMEMIRRQSCIRSKVHNIRIENRSEHWRNRLKRRGEIRSCARFRIRGKISNDVEKVRNNVEEVSKSVNALLTKVSNEIQRSVTDLRQRMHDTWTEEMLKTNEIERGVTDLRQRMNNTVTKETLEKSFKTTGRDTIVRALQDTRKDISNDVKKVRNNVEEVSKSVNALSTKREIDAAFKSRILTSAVVNADYIESRRFLENAREIVLERVRDEIATKRAMISVCTTNNACFAIENKQVLPLRLTSDKKEKHVNVLYVFESRILTGAVINSNDKRANKSNYKEQRDILMHRYARVIRATDQRNDSLDHFAWIKNLSRFVRSQITRNKNKKYFCNRSCEKLQSREVDCQKVNNCTIRLPSEDDRWFEFGNYNNQKEGYQFCSSGTRPTKRLARGDAGRASEEANTKIGIGMKPKRRYLDPYKYGRGLYLRKKNVEEIRMPSGAITNVQVNVLAYFRGVFMRDTLPMNGAHRNESGIVNLDDATGPGIHWVAYAKRNNDSFGNLRPPKELLRYFGNGAKTIETVLNHLHKAGYKKKLDVWVSHELSVKNMIDRIKICDTLLKRNKIASFLKRMITGDKKWITYDNRKRSWIKEGEKA
ncbi:SETMR methyltransferase, partial [Acromyrmex charruanus]